MRSVSVRARSAALLLLLVLATVPVLADDPPPGTEPPQARIQIPVGVTSQAEPSEEPSFLDLFLIWLQARITIPVG